MEIQDYIKDKKDFYHFILDYIEEDQEENSFKMLFENIQNKLKFLSEIKNDKEEIEWIFHLVLKISNNHLRNPVIDFKIIEILSYFINEIKQLMSNFEIFDFFKNNKRILYFLFKNQVLTIDETITHFIVNHLSYCYFFYPEIKSHLTIEKQEKIEKELLSINPDIFTNFEEKRQIGENDSYLCKLIRDDSIVEFITYVTKNNYSLSSEINHSIFETNSYIEKNGTTMIEYASFFGSIQIFQYLKLNGVQITEKLLKYAIHSKNGELIHLIEENCNISSNIQLCEECMVESIKCHHNDIANYYETSFLTELSEKIACSGIHYYNYVYFPDEVESGSTFFYLNMYKHNILVNLYLKKKEAEYESKNIQTNNIIKSATNDQLEIIYLLLSKKDNIKKFMFRDCKLNRISIPSTIKVIGKFAFDGSKISEISLPTSVTVINEFAFRDCISLIKISIPSSVKTFCDFAFRNCTSLEKVTFGISSCLESIGKFAFDGCKSLKKIIIPSSVKKIHDYVFRSCESLVEIYFEIPSSLDSIGIFAFDSCLNLKQITIPSSVSTIGKYMFRDCVLLTNFAFENPSLVKSIGDNIFCRCSSLMHVTIPKSMENSLQLNPKVTVTKFE